MKNIKSYARFLELFCYIAVIPAMIFLTIYKWFVDCFPWFERSHAFWVRFAYTFNLSVGPMPMLSRFLGVVIECVSLGLFLWGVICFIQVLRLYQHAQIFTQQIFLLFRKISRIALAWAIYEPIKVTLGSLVATLHNPVGKRIIMVSVEHTDIINIFLVGFLLVITSLIYEGFKLKQEQDLTV